MSTFYSDINLNFVPHPLTGDVTFLSDADAVKRALVHIGEMVSFDIPFEPDLHGHTRELLFEIPSDTTKSALEKLLRWAINKLEPRAAIDEIVIDLAMEESAYQIEVKFHVISLIEQQSVKFYLERIR